MLLKVGLGVSFDNRNWNWDGIKENERIYEIITRPIEFTADVKLATEYFCILNALEPSVKNSLISLNIIFV
jgi:hypothetical protein